MQQASRIAIIGLLALMQLFAPLVHAHTGGEQFSGAIHIPGLEFLAKANGKSAQLLTHKACFDFIVGPAPGLKLRGDHSASASDPEFAPPANISLAADSPLGLKDYSHTLPFSSTRQSWLTPSPRAPPRLG